MADLSAGPSTPPVPPAAAQGSPPDPEALSASARGWHRIQLAVLGFIGFCGILWEGDDSAATAVQYAGLLLIVTAFVLAVLSILVVGRVAHPVAGPSDAAEGTAVVARRTRHLRRGIWGTYLAVALLVLATLSSWLPAGADAGPGADGEAVASGAQRLVMVATDERSWCGRPVDADDRVVRLRTTQDVVDLRWDRITVLQPVRTC